MSLLLYLRGSHWRPEPSTPAKQSHERKRLQKAPRDHAPRKSLYSCKQALEVDRAQHCLSILSEDTYLTTIDHQKKIATKTRPQVGFQLKNRPLNSSEDLISNCSENGVELRPLRRTRPKTPVFTIGQLERKSIICSMDQAQDLAKQYQTVLPPRAITPFTQLDHPNLTHKKPRKIKCQVSLRDLIKTQANGSTTSTSRYSDYATLVGSESPSVPISPTKSCFGHEKMPVASPDEVAHTVYDAKNAHSHSISPLDDNIGLKICVDLLTNELATALYRQHPAEREDRASGLQILLMIEAYETILQHVHQRMGDPRATKTEVDHVKSVEKILDHWLQIMYSVYDRSQEEKGEKEVAEDSWPLRSPQ